jgi:hypothetical protein
MRVGSSRTRAKWGSELGGGQLRECLEDRLQLRRRSAANMYFERRSPLPDIYARETGILNVVGVIPNTLNRRLGHSRHGLFGTVEPVNGRQTPHLTHDIDLDHLPVETGLPDFM